METRINKLSFNESESKKHNNLYESKKAFKQLTNVPMTSSKTQPKKVDESCDGKFSWFEAAKNFGKGIISPVTSMFESKKNLLIGTAMIVGSAALVVATGGAAAPILVAAGVAMGTVQAGQAGYKMVTAKNGDDVEKAFYDAGGATGTIGLSLLGAKGSLKQAHISTKGLNAFSSTAKCITASKKLSVESYNVFKSGHYRANFYDAGKYILQPQKVRDYSKEISQEAKKHFKESAKEIKSILPKEYQSGFTARPKGEMSIQNKLEKYSKSSKKKILKKIQEINANKNIPNGQKALLIKALKEKKSEIKITKNYAKEEVKDLIGTRLVLKNTDNKSINKLVSSLIKAINEDTLVITELENYRGHSGEFYFSKAHVDAIRNACEAKNIKIDILEGAGQIKRSGYTAVQMTIKHSSGYFGELQIRGNLVDKVAHWEHIAYDLRTGKNLSKGNNEVGITLAPIDKAIRKLTPKQYEEYENYIARNFLYAQKKELGLKTKRPKLPEDINPILKASNLEKINNKIKVLPTYSDRSPFTLTAQLPLVYEAEKFLENK